MVEASTLVNEQVNIFSKINNCAKSSFFFCYTIRQLHLLINLRKLTISKGMYQVTERMLGSEHPSNQSPPEL